jgi:hypothetical protein
LFLIIVNVCIRTSKGGRPGLTSNFLCGGGMYVFWNDPLLDTWADRPVKLLYLLNARALPLTSKLSGGRQSKIIKQGALVQYCNATQWIN